MGLPVDECANVNARARCRPKVMADNRVVAEGEDGYFNMTTGLPVGLHMLCVSFFIFKLQQRTTHELTRLVYGESFYLIGHRDPPNICIILVYRDKAI
jgi:hypothetical protein